MVEHRSLSAEIFTIKIGRLFSMGSRGRETGGRAPRRVIRALVDFRCADVGAAIDRASGAYAGAVYRVVDFLERQICCYASRGSR